MKQQFQTENQIQTILNKCTISEPLVQTMHKKSTQKGHVQKIGNNVILEPIIIKSQERGGKKW
jgi:hypothetical protein